MNSKKHSIIRSRSGASLSMALLLFLVCAVIGAVVLTAGTAAAGRVSRLAEMDQRYYSVSSAAQLLAEELSGKTVTVVKGFTGSEEDLKNLEKMLKTKCGTGGSSKDGVIILQGEMKDKLVTILRDLGYTATK